jgi:hypothetical protein
MACTVKHPVQLEVSLDTKGQTREKVTAIVDALLRQHGVIECGLLGYFSLALGKGSEEKLGSVPGSDLKKDGVLAVRTTEAH